MNKDYHTIVVGAGAVGLASALALTQQGYRVALIAAAVPQITSSDPERAIALSHGSCKLLEQWGVWSAILGLGTGVISHIHVCDPAGKGRVSIDCQELPIAALGHVVEMGHIIAPLWQAVAASCDVFCPASVTALDETPDGIQLSLSHNDSLCLLHARLLVAADGSYSPIRKMAAMPTQGWPHNRFALVASVATEHPHHNTAYECFEHDGPLALLPMADGRLSLVWALAPSEAMRLLQCGDAAFMNTLTAAIYATPAAALGAVSSIGKRGSFPLELRLARSMAKGRVVLVGNAGHCIHPVAGQGMNLGFRDVADLTALLAQPMAQDDPAASVALQRYVAQRRLDVSLVAGFTEGLLAGFSAKHAVATAVRRCAMHAMVQKTPWKTLMLQHATGMAQRSQS